MKYDDFFKEFYKLPDNTALRFQEQLNWFCHVHTHNDLFLKWSQVKYKHFTQWNYLPDVFKS